MLHELVSFLETATQPAADRGEGRPWTALLGYLELEDLKSRGGEKGKVNWLIPFQQDFMIERRGGDSESECNVCL